MAKLLPYFKFFSSEWNDGDITLENYKTQGVFINICSYYWSKECDVPFNHVFKRFKSVKEEIDTLVSSEIIYDCNGKLCIKFLDEQLAERNKQRKVNSENAKKRWSKVQIASNSKSESNAIKIIEDKDIDNNRFLVKSKQDDIWLESVAMKNKITIDNVKKGLDLFINHLISIKQQHNNYREFCNHFSNWVSIQKQIKQKPILKEQRL